MRDFFNWVSNRHLATRILQGLKQNFVPGLILWILGLGLVGTYYLVESARPLFLQISAWKQDYGYAYSAFSTALFGGLLPFVFMRLTGRGGRGSPLLYGFIFVIYWAFRGIDVDAFYRLQAMIFGTGVDWRTIAVEGFGGPVCVLCFLGNPSHSTFLCLDGCRLFRKTIEGGKEPVRDF